MVVAGCGVAGTVVIGTCRNQALRMPMLMLLELVNSLGIGMMTTTERMLAGSQIVHWMKTVYLLIQLDSPISILT